MLVNYVVIMEQAVREIQQDIITQNALLIQQQLIPIQHMYKQVQQHIVGVHMSVQLLDILMQLMHKHLQLFMRMIHWLTQHIHIIHIQQEYQQPYIRGQP